MEVIANYSSGGANLNMRLQIIKKRVWLTRMYVLVFKSGGDSIRTWELVLPKHLGEILNKSKKNIPHNWEYS